MLNSCLSFIPIYSYGYKYKLRKLNLIHKCRVKERLTDLKLDPFKVFVLKTSCSIDKIKGLDQHYATNLSSTGHDLERKENPPNCQNFYFKQVCCRPSGIAYRTTGFEGLTYGASHMKYPFLSSCKTSPRFRFRMLESPTAAISVLVHGFSTSRKSSPSSSCNDKLTATT